MFDPHATAEAIRILEMKRVEAAPLPASLWRFLHHASRHLDNQLKEYFREPQERQTKAA
jgi:hypothetical protein